MSGQLARVMVTGGAGYIGSQTCKALAAHGYTPVTYDNLSEGNQWAVQWGPFERGDILDAKRLREVMKAYEPVAIVHFAALALVGESVVDPARYYQNNTVGSITLFEAARSCGVPHIVLSSTCAIYGKPERLPISEHDPQNPVNPYGASKLAVERILLDYDAAYRMKSAILRYFNAAGADPDGSVGEERIHETHLIPLALDAILGRRPPLKIFGDDYPTPDGTAIRDYVHVADLAQAHVAALEILQAKDTSLVCNLGTGHGSSVREVLSIIEQLTGRSVPKEFAPRRAGDPPELVAECARMKGILGLDPDKLQSLESMIETAWAWRVSRGLACAVSGRTYYERQR
jgi:UDP-arabinose 4-epimerase